MALARSRNASDPVMQRVGCRRVIQSSRLFNGWRPHEVGDFIETHGVAIFGARDVAGDARGVHLDAVCGPKASIDDLGIHQSIIDGVQGLIAPLSWHGNRFEGCWGEEADGTRKTWGPAWIADATHPQGAQRAIVCADEEP